MGFPSFSVAGRLRASASICDLRMWLDYSIYPIWAMRQWQKLG